MFVETKEVGEVQQAPTTEKLSDAIRRGCKVRPVQCRGTYFNGRDAACALGAAYEGLDCHDYKGRVSLPTYLSRRLNMPEAVIAEVIFRNDFDKQSRESIADWLESQGW